jgi:hypothetical protein
MNPKEQINKSYTFNYKQLTGHKIHMYKCEKDLWFESKTAINCKQLIASHLLYKSRVIKHDIYAFNDSPVIK